MPPRIPGATWSQNRRERARALALLHTGGAVLALAPAALPHPRGIDERPLAFLAVAAIASAAAFLVIDGRLPALVCQITVAVDTLIISSILHFAHLPATEAYSVYYISIAVYAFHFFRREQAFAHVALMALGYALASGASTGGWRWVTPWIVTIVTAVMAGSVVGSLSRRARKLARTDALTGAANRIAWEEALAREAVRAERERAPLSIALLDLDYFKECNDRGGHQAGDRVLQQAVSAWRLELRRTDVLARWGGDEFAILLPSCTPDNAVAIVERLRKVMPKSQTFSAGVARWEPGEPTGEVVLRADRELYEAKRAGRNRTVTAS